MVMKGGNTVPPARGAGAEHRDRPRPDEPDTTNRWLASVSQHVPLLYRFIRHEIAYLEATGDLEPGALAAEDVVDSMLVRAQREFPGTVPESQVRGWLIRRSLEQLQREAKRLQAESGRKVYLEIDSSELPTDPAAVLLDELPYFYEPNELNVDEVVPDPGAPTPELEAQRQELWTCATRVLASMRSEVRHALTLYHVEGLTAAELAAALDKSVHDIPSLLDQARKEYRERLIAAGCREKDAPDRAP